MKIWVIPNFRKKGNSGFFTKNVIICNTGSYNSPLIRIRIGTTLTTQGENAYSRPILRAETQGFIAINSMHFNYGLV
jgi:hypothetical protein